MEHSTPHTVLDYSECVGAHEHTMTLYILLASLRQPCSLYVYVSGNIIYNSHLKKMHQMIERRLVAVLLLPGEAWERHL